MEFKRDPLVTTLLAVFVPFYVLYWFYDTAKIIRSKGVPSPSFALLLGPTLGVVVAYLMIFILPFLFPSGSDAAIGIGFLLVFFLLFPLFFGLTLYYYYKFGTSVSHMTSGSLSPGLLFILFWFVSPAGVYLSQEKLNQLGGINPAAPMPPAGAPPQPPQAPLPPTQPTI